VHGQCQPGGFDHGEEKGKVMTISHARQLKRGDQVVAFNGNATLYARVVKTEPKRNAILITARYLKKDGKLGEMERTHRGFLWYGDFPSDNFPKCEEIGL